MASLALSLEGQTWIVIPRSTLRKEGGSESEVVKLNALLESGVDKRVVSKRVVLADVPRNENRNEGTFGCSPGTKKKKE